MIRHIVFFTADDPAKLVGIRQGLSLLGEIPLCQAFEVSDNLKLDSTNNSVDIVLYAEFRNVEDLAAFKAHPNYRRATERVKPLRELRLVGDIEAAG